MSDLKDNGLTHSKIKSKSESMTGITDIKNKVKEKNIRPGSYIIAYLDNTVLVGKYDGNDFNFYNDKLFDNRYVQKIRIFNKEEELLLWRSGSGFKGRYRKDGDGDEIDVVDAEQVLFGTDKEDLGNNLTRLFEKRGTEIILPFTVLDVKDKEKDKRVFIQTRNYVGENEASQATYVDCRFMGFKNVKS